METNYIDTVNFIADKAGILQSFEADSGICETSFETKKALLKALNLPVNTEKQALESLNKILEKPFKRALPSVIVCRQNKHITEVAVSFLKSENDDLLSWEIILESGEKLQGSVSVSEMAVVNQYEFAKKQYEQRLLVLPIPTEYGYHTLKVSGAKSLIKQGLETSFIVAPEKCYMPEKMAKGQKPWGFPLQLYALRSENNWGIGDFSDLKEFTKVAKKFGADIVGINPINVAFMAEPETASPYYSSSRMYLNPLYIDISKVAEAKNSKTLNDYMAKPAFKKDLKKAKESKQVDYTLVSKLKTKAFEILFEEFKTAPKERQKSFEEFCQKEGNELHSVALYQALSAEFVKKKKSMGFRAWGEKYASPIAVESLKFATKNAEKVRFYKYLFWLADEQFEIASQESKNQDLSIGLYQDLAVGVACDSAETWGAQDLFAIDLSIGSPPDMFNANGQQWGVAPMRPEVMKDEGYASYIKVLRANMKRAGAVRIDHVMGLVRLFSIPQNEKGAYILYNVEDLVGIVALESHRNQCLVVGEDLGVVPNFFRDLLLDMGILSFRVFRYEQTSDGRYKSISEYPETALVAAGTHDMPTLSGYWKGADIQVSKDIGIMGEELYNISKDNRLKDRYAMIETLAKKGCWFVSEQDFQAEISGEKVPSRLTEVVYEYLAGASCSLLLVQLEDVLNQVEQMNLPGTSLEYPNWRFKLPKTIEELYNNDDMKRICEVISKSR